MKEAPKEIETHPQWDISEEEEDQEVADDSAVSDSDLLESGDSDSDSDAQGEEEEEE